MILKVITAIIKWQENTNSIKCLCKDFWRMSDLMDLEFNTLLKADAPAVVFFKFQSSKVNRLDKITTRLSYSNIHWDLNDFLTGLQMIVSRTRRKLQEMK